MEKFSNNFENSNPAFIALNEQLAKIQEDGLVEIPALSDYLEATFDRESLLFTGCKLESHT